MIFSRRFLSFVLLLLVPPWPESWGAVAYHQQLRHRSPSGETSISSPKQQADDIGGGHRCSVRLPEDCTCSKNDGSLGITCFRVGLSAVPQLEVGATKVKTLNFEQNNLTQIDIGAFFGLKIERLLLSNNSIHSLNFLAFWGLEYHLETLDLSYNSFNDVPSEALQLLRNLRSLSLTGNKITFLRDFDFGYLRRLEVLALDKNPITSIAPHTFEGTQLSLLTLNAIRLERGLGSFPTSDLKFLKGLSLAENGITRLPEGWFRNLKSLQYLCLNGNRIKEVEMDAFKGIEYSLRTLELNSNGLREIPRAALWTLPKLQTLALRGNKIRKLYARSFNESRSLESLDLSNNRLNKISRRAFAGLDDIRKIDLRNNSLITLDETSFYWQNYERKEIHLGGNPWLCNCLLKWLKREFRRMTSLANSLKDPMAMLCDSPRLLEGVPVKRVHLRDFTCNHGYYYYDVRERGKNKNKNKAEEEDRKDRKSIEKDHNPTPKKLSFLGPATTTTGPSTESWVEDYRTDDDDDDDDDYNDGYGYDDDYYYTDYDGYYYTDYGDTDSYKHK